MTYRVTAKPDSRGWELNVHGVGAARSTGLGDSEATIRDVLSRKGLDSTASIAITFEFPRTGPALGHGSDRAAWKARARSDMRRLADEDLSDEPDAWEYDETGNVRVVRTDFSA